MSSCWCSGPVYLCVLRQRGPPRSDSSGASADLASTAGQAADDLSGHRYYHLPTWVPSPGLRPPTNLRLRSYSKQCLEDLLLQIRKLLIKPHLSLAEAQALVDSTERLVRHAARYMPKDIKAGSKENLVLPLARRFLVADAVISAWQVVRPIMPMPARWRALATKLSTAPVNWPLLQSYPASRGSLTDLTNELGEALEIYGQGQRPPAHTVVYLKRQIFFRRPGDFADSRWDPWRQDNEA